MQMDDLQAPFDAMFEAFAADIEDELERVRNEIAGGDAALERGRQTWPLFGILAVLLVLSLVISCCLRPRPKWGS